MKRSFCSIFVVLMCTSSAFASAFIDGGSFHSTSKSAGWQSGVSVNLGFPIHSDVDLMLRSVYSSVIDNEGKANQVDYRFLYFMLGAEYSPSLSFLDRYRIVWNTMFLMGGLHSKVDGSVAGNDLTGWNFDFEFLTGIQYGLSQHFAPFLNLGYHIASDKKKLSDIQERGFQIEFGLRFYFSDSRDYSKGY